MLESRPPSCGFALKWPVLIRSDGIFVSGSILDTSGHATRHPLAQRLKFTAVALGCSLVALVAATVFLGKQAQLVQVSMAAHTALGGWVGRLQRVSLALGEAESSQRGYLLTGKDQYLAPYHRAVSLLPQALGALDAIPIDDPELAALVSDIRHQSDLKLVELSRTISLYQQGRRDAAIALVQSDSGEHSMEQVRADVDKAIDIVMANRNALNSRVASGSAATGSLAILTVVALIATVILAAAQIAALMRAQRRYQGALAAKEQFVRDIADSVPVRLAYFDTRGCFQFVNRTLCERFGLAREVFLGKTLSEVTNSAPKAALADPLHAAMLGQLQRFEYADTFDGKTSIIETQFVPDLDANGAVCGVFGVGVDITQLVSGRRELNRQAVTLNAIVDSIPAMVGVCDTELNYQLVNRAYESWRGKGRQEFVGRNLKEMLSEVEFQRSLPWIQRALAGETVSYEVENSWDAEARHLAITYIPLRMTDGSIGGFVGLAEDITVHREENQRLLLLAERDPLTGLLNKAGFETYLTQKVARGEGGQLAILYIDLDRFKPINDTHGHPAGDEVLRQFAMRLHSVVRPTDAVARLGGDEFVVVLAGIREAKNAAMVAEKVVRLAHQPISIGDQDVVAGASIGVACNADLEGGWKALLARADEMVYRAKAEGRGRYVLAPQEVVRLPERQLRAS
jgi:diguanylate cyclase (GGDEF)-like protein/PAS domain S-box-containing protein